MLQKILDKYYAEKAIESVCTAISVMKIDTKIVKEKRQYSLYIKKPKYEDKYYKHFFTVRFEYALGKYLDIYNTPKKEFTDKVEEYLDSER